jgi:hypothetical protein
MGTEALEMMVFGSSWCLYPVLIVFSRGNGDRVRMTDSGNHHKAGDDTWHLVISTRLGTARLAFPVTWETGGEVPCLDTVQETVSVPGGG